jgi:hypothetical protein
MERPMTEKNLPWWLGPASRANMWLLRRGLRIGTQHILSVPGRKSGLMRTRVSTEVRAVQFMLLARKSWSPREQAARRAPGADDPDRVLGDS